MQNEILNKIDFLFVDFRSNIENFIPILEKNSKKKDKWLKYLKKFFLLVLGRNNFLKIKLWNVTPLFQLGHFQ